MQDPAYYELFRDYQFDDLISLIGPTEHFPMHFHKKFELTYILEGGNISVVSNKKYKSEKDDILFIPQCHPHSYATTKNTKRFVFMPSEDNMEDVASIFEKRFLPPLLTDKAFHREKILPLFAEMYATSKNECLEKSVKQALLKGYTNLVLGRLAERYADLFTETTQTTELLFNILMYIEEHYFEDITLESLAKHFGYNKFYFSRMFNFNIGENFNTYLNGVRVKKLILKQKKQSAENITEMAFQVGFNSMPTFYRAFHRIYRCSPKKLLK